MDLRIIHGSSDDDRDVSTQARFQAGIQRYVSHGTHLCLQGDLGGS